MYNFENEYMAKQLHKLRLQELEEEAKEHHRSVLFFENLRRQRANRKNRNQQR